MMLQQDGHPEAVALADAFCREARERVAASFRALFGKHDPALYKLAQQVLGGEHAWLEAGIVGVMPKAPPAGDAATDAPDRADAGLRREAVAVGN
jgi:hypothetical protein